MLPFFTEQYGNPSAIYSLGSALSISLPLSLLCNAAIYFGADFIAGSLLQEPRTAPMLRILSFSVPMSAVHACVNGHFYGVISGSSQREGEGQYGI